MNPMLKTLTLSTLILGNARASSETVASRYVEFPVAIPGTVLKLEKVLDESGHVRLKKGDAALSISELLQWEGLEAQARKGKNGNLSEVLEAKRPSLGLLETIKVVISSKYPPITYPDKTTSSEATLIGSSIAAGALAPITSAQTIAALHGLGNCQYSGVGKATCTVSRLQLDALKTNPLVGFVDEIGDDQGASVELSTLAASAYNPGSVPSGAGSGVHAATFEYGLTSTFVSCLGVSVTYDASTTSDQADIRHTHAAFKSLVHAAPSAAFFHRKSLAFDGSDDQNYIINNGIQTVSMSWERGGTSPYRSTNSEFLVMDDFAYRYPYPVFVTPTANSGYQYEVNWQCYNAISVGNVRHTNGSTYEMADCTQVKNPPPVYGSCISGSGSNCAGDREMPYVIVPGIPSSGSDFATTCLGGAGTVGCGTSWSAPVGNGIAADMIAADSRLASWPEKVRAAMILTSHNVDGGHWSSGTDGRDGSGVVSGADGVSFAQNHTSVSAGNSACEKGMGASSLYASDFGAGNKRFNYYVPNPKPSGKHLRVVLTWDSNPVVGGGVNALSDLDLIVQKNSTTQGSYIWDGNVEVVDVAAADLSAGSSYYIDISPAINRIPSSGSRANYIYYSIAWAWVKDHAD